MNDPIVLEEFNDSYKPFKALAEATERVVGKIIDEFGVNSSILLIGRYNYDMYKLCQTDLFSEMPNGQLRSKKYPNAKITYMTAHSSKGLGFDNVVLINMFEGMHICEVCGRKEILTPQEAFDQGWDYPPMMGHFGVLSPRTCPNCNMMDTVWAAITMLGKRAEDLTDEQQQVIVRIVSEPDSILVHDE